MIWLEYLNEISDLCGGACVHGCIKHRHRERNMASPSQANSYILSLFCL